MQQAVHAARNHSVFNRLLTSVRRPLKHLLGVGGPAACAGSARAGGALTEPLGDGAFALGVRRTAAAGAGVHGL